MELSAPVLLVAGTRPEVVKLAPVARALRSRGVRCAIVAAGQHPRLVRSALDDFGLRAGYVLPAGPARRGLNDLAAAALKALGRLLRRVEPALVVVQGDTTTAAMGALAAFHERVPVAHVEAGLRTYDLDSPYPEELNRLVADAVAALHFAPTAGAAANLRREALARRGVFVTGNTGVDALAWMLARRREVRSPALARALRLARAQDGFVLATLHRREALGAPLRSLCGGLARLLDARPGLHLIWPVHPNPAVRREARALARHPRAHLLAPLCYGDAVGALRACRFVATDSGGLQEEAPFAGKPVLVLRRVTERPEAVAAGAALVAGLDGGRLFRLASRLLDDAPLYRRMAKPRKLFGDGRAAERVAAGIARFLRAGRRRA